jgi:hypothetical protein
VPLTFQGNPPFSSTLAQDSSADAENGIVVLIVHLYVDEKWPLGAEIWVKMDRDEAQIMHNRLGLAIQKAGRQLKDL